MLNRYFQNIGFKGAELFALPGVPTCLGLTLVMTDVVSGGYFIVFQQTVLTVVKYVFREQRSRR
jgi:hypothetical protein